MTLPLDNEEVKILTGSFDVVVFERLTLETLFGENSHLFQNALALLKPGGTLVMNAPPSTVSKGSVDSVAVGTDDDGPTLGVPLTVTLANMPLSKQFDTRHILESGDVLKAIEEWSRAVQVTIEGFLKPFFGTKNLIQFVGEMKTCEIKPGERGHPLWIKQSTASQILIIITKKKI